MKLIDKVTNTIASPPCETQAKNLRGLLSLSPPKKKKHHFGEAFEFGPWPSEILYALGNFNLISSSPTLKLKHIRTWNVSFEILGGLSCFKGYHRVTIKPQSTLELLEANWRTPPLCNHRWNRVISTKAAHESLHMCLHCFQGADTATLPRSVGCSHLFSQTWTRYKYGVHPNRWEKQRYTAMVYRSVRILQPTHLGTNPFAGCISLESKSFKDTMWWNSMGHGMVSVGKYTIHGSFGVWLVLHHWSWSLVIFATIIEWEAVTFGGHSFGSLDVPFEMDSFRTLPGHMNTKKIRIHESKAPHRRKQHGHVKYLNFNIPCQV